MSLSVEDLGKRLILLYTKVCKEKVHNLTEMLPRKISALICTKDDKKKY